MLKNFLPLFLSLCLISCRKDRNTTTVTGTVTEFGTNTPLTDVVINYFACIGGAADCPPSVTTKTDENGYYSITFPSNEPYILRVGPETPNGYFSVNAAPVSASQDSEKNFTLSPHAYLHLTIKNVAPANELDLVRVGFNLGLGGWNEYSGEFVNETALGLVKGNRTGSLVWRLFNSGEFIEELSDEIYLPAHDTIYYTIEY